MRSEPALSEKARLRALDFVGDLYAICLRSLADPGRPLRWLALVNPAAGGFSGRAWRKSTATIEEVARDSWGNGIVRKDWSLAKTLARSGAPSDFAEVGATPVEKRGDAGRIARLLVQEALESAGLPGDETLFLFVIIGGDGTSQEALSVLLEAPREARERIAVARLPMGTGNDGADSRDLAEALRLIYKPSRLELVPALSLAGAPGGPLSRRGALVGFNTISLGLDAFVARMTERTKKKLPGDFYKLWVDIAALFYDRLYKTGPLRVRAFDENGAPAAALDEKLLLIAVGASGRRTYGSGKNVLPDERNVCAIRQTNLSRKLALKRLLCDGLHADEPETILFGARRIEISGENPILAQADGETLLIQKEDFPLVITLSEPAIRAIRPEK